VKQALTVLSALEFRVFALKGDIENVLILHFFGFTLHFWVPIRSLDR